MTFVEDMEATLTMLEQFQAKWFGKLVLPNTRKTSRFIGMAMAFDPSDDSLLEEILRVHPWKPNCNLRDAWAALGYSHASHQGDKDMDPIKLEALRASLEKDKLRVKVMVLSTGVWENVPVSLLTEITMDEAKKLLLQDITRSL